MSFDLEIWSPSPFAVSEALDSYALQASNANWICRREGWQIVVDRSISVEEDDIPDDVKAQWNGIRHLTRITLEPIHAPKAAYDTLQQLSTTIAKGCRGVVWDCQAGQIAAVPAKKKNPSRSSEPQALDLLTMSWWFTEGVLTTPEGALKLIRYLEQNVPEFAPRRYGEFEPPPYTFDSNQPEPFLQFIFEQKIFGTIWKASSLFSVSYTPAVGPGWLWRPGAGKHMFVIPQLVLQAPSRLLSEPRWSRSLRDLWNWVNQLAEPMYGDVRILKGAWSQGIKIVYIAGMPCDSHPNEGAWRGLPKTLGLATVVGKPYLDLWLGCVKRNMPRAARTFPSAWTIGHRRRTLPRLPEKCHATCGRPMTRSPEGTEPMALEQRYGLLKRPRLRNRNREVI